jgi:hypothetical protein
MIANTYRRLVPLPVREQIYTLFLKKILFYKRNFHILGKAFWVYRLPFFQETELNNTLKFIGQHGLRSCPGNFSLKYDDFVPEVFRDTHSFVMHHGKKLYFPQTFTDVAVKKLYKSLIVEQDPESAHRYTNEEDDFQNAIMFDIGGAEGILTLENIEQLKYAIIVECENEWIEALKLTFAPYSDKVTLVHRFIDDHESPTSTTLNTLGHDFRNEKIFLKMDVEGFEQKALEAAKELLINNDCIAAICTYHNPSHPASIKAFFENLGYTASFSKGHLYWANRLSKALIRARKI